MKHILKLLSACIVSMMLLFAGSSAYAAGDGSQNNPYTCSQVMALKNPGTKAWIKGYIVGTMNTDKTPNVFETNQPFEYYANIFLADNPDETDTKNCVPVQLASGSVARSQLNLVDNPGNHRALYALQGDLLAYFGQPGLKNIGTFIKLDSSTEDPGENPGLDIDDNLTFDITVSTPGTLQKEFAALDADEVYGLVIKGKINSADIIFLNSSSGRIASVKHLDLSEITLDYDGKVYASNTSAPEAGMGTKHTYNYILSEENYVEDLPFDFIAGYTTNYYRNNLSNAFCSNKHIESVVLPKWMKQISSAILYDCENLKSVTLPDGVTEIEDRAFGGCLKLVVPEIPSTVERIGAYAFNKATITQDKLVFDHMVIGKGAFSYCKGIKSLEITNSGDIIQQYAFNHCSDLKEIKIGEGVKYIGDAAFKSCKIETAELPSTLTEIGREVFLNCPFLKSLPVDNNVRYLGNIAYDLTDKTLSEYTIREGTKMLAPALFWNASQPKVNLPSSIEIIGAQSLSQTSNKTLPELPELRRIDDRAFEFCPLTSVVIPEKVELIHNDAFMECNNIWKVNYKAINAKVVDDWLLFKCKIEQVTLGDKVERIPCGLYTNNDFISEIILPASVTSIAPNAFAGCSKLEYINLNDNITEICDNAFGGCESLRKIHWPAHLKRVGYDAFRSCSSLETISLPEGLTTFGNSAFTGCSSVKNLYIPSTLESDHAYYFGINNQTVNHFTVTCTTETPYNMGWSFDYMAKTTFRVPAASLDKYKSDPNWNGSYADNRRPEIIAIESISAPEENSQISFKEDISSDTDLSDTIVGDVYVTLGENDGYDETDGAISLVDTMADEYVDAIGGMIPGQSDLANRFNGLVVMVPAGNGKIVINCLTLGDKYISVKIGNEEPLVHSKDERGDIIVEYDVTENTYVYIYATENSENRQNVPQSRAVTPSDNCVKIYAIGINPEQLGIETVFEDTASKLIIEYWRLDGIKVDKPQSPGLYIGRCADGSNVKVHIR